VNEPDDNIQLHVANIPFDGTTCIACRASTWKDGPPLFKLTIGGFDIRLCYGCLEILSKLTKVFVFEKTTLRPE
jgi:hypothetical protein